MPRPKRKRRICGLPKNSGFTPGKAENLSADAVNMTLDEYESIRLIDYAGLTQEECAEFMGVARTTAQLIYNSARKKLAVMLVEGKELSLQGGNYEISGDENPGYGRCRRGRMGSVNND